MVTRTRVCRVLNLHQVGDEHLAFRLRTEQQSADQACSAEQIADQHRQREAHVVLDREI